MEPLNLYRDIPNIVRACPDYDVWQVVELVCEKSGRAYLNGEDTQTLKALYLRAKLAGHAQGETEPEGLSW